MTLHPSEGTEYFQKATYWKNGVVIPIIGADLNTSFKGIAVSGSDVYICGRKYLGGGVYYVSKYWKNGVEIDLTDGTSSTDVTDIAVSGSDVFVSGFEYPIAKYWKNGVATPLSDGSPFLSTATGITISGQDVYVCGTVILGPRNSSIKYWKNGVPITVTDGTTASQSAGISVSGSDIYVSGVEYSFDLAGSAFGVAKYWKNGVATTLAAPGTFNCYSLSISVLGDDVFVPVSLDYIYKNGTLVPPFPLTDQFTRLYGAVIITY